MDKPFSEPSNLTEQMQNLCWRLAVEMRSLFNTVSNKLSTDDADDRYLAKTGKAVSAMTADTATKADSATTADTATMATQDGNGNVISSTYAKNTSIPTTMKGATSSSAGTSGTVPTPAAGTEGKFLRGDGTWQTPSVPTKTSELTNNSGYITSTALADYAKTSALPTKTSQLTNDSGFLTSTGLIGLTMTEAGGVELTTSSASTHGGFIDFHFKGSTADYTSRILEQASGKLSITASSGLFVNNNEVLTTAKVDSALSTTSTLPVQNSVVTTQINTNAGLSARRYLTTMVALGFTANSTTAIGDFFTKLASLGYRNGDIISFEWANASMASVTDGTNTLTLNGGTLVIGKVQSHANIWSSSQALWYPNGNQSANAYLLYASIGGTSGTYNTKGVIKVANSKDLPTITSSTTNLTAGTSALATGAVYLVYE